MDIIVCVKQIQDPEIPPTKFKIDPQANKVIPPEAIPPVMSPFDAQAVEAALRIKGKQSSKITALTMGSAPAIGDVIKQALSMGADEGIILNDKAFEGSDSFSTAYVLTQAIKKIGKFDLILCGRQAADWDRGLVGALIAENLGIPIITFARKIEVADGAIRVERVLMGGYEVIDVPPPAVVTVSNELGQPRIPTGFQIIAAVRKKVPTWTAADLGLDASQTGAAGARADLQKLYIPSRERKCTMFSGETAAADLALLLKKDGVI